MVRLEFFFQIINPLGVRLVHFFNYLSFSMPIWFLLFSSQSAQVKYVAHGPLVCNIGLKPYLCKFVIWLITLYINFSPVLIKVKFWLNIEIQLCRKVFDRLYVFLVWHITLLVIELELMGIIKSHFSYFREYMHCICISQEVVWPFIQEHVIIWEFFHVTKKNFH